MKPIQILVTIVLLLVVGGGSFFAGMKYQSFRRASVTAQTIQLNPLMSASRDGTGTGSAFLDW